MFIPKLFKFYFPALILCLLGIAACDNSNKPSPTPMVSPSPSPTPTVVGFSERPSNASCLAGDAPASPIRLQRIFAGLSLNQPLDLRQVPGDASGMFYIAEKEGRIIAVPADDLAGDDDAQLALQLDVFSEEEAGIAAMAFHPNYAENGRVFITYVASVNPGPLELRLSEFARAADGIAFENEKILMRIHERNPIHFGGDLQFGPEGMLYMSVGDDGDNSIGDTQPMQAQDPSSVYGSILRIDVDNVEVGSTYSIPNDNPTFDGAEANEVWAIGFRNPWRFSFDSQPPHTAWGSNVGASFREEINIIEAGANYGWPHCEGYCESNEPNLVDPVYAYRNSTGAAAVGGYVYRGSALPDLYGQYIFGGFASQSIWALNPSLDQDNPLFVKTLANTSFNFADFAIGNDKELYVVGLTNGAIYRIEANANTGGEAPATLSASACFSSLQGGNPVPAEGVIAYDVAQPFWSDGATKKRLLALPDGSTINASDPDNWQLPNNAVTIKHFYWQDQIFETRFFVRYTDGSYGGFSYAWNESLDDALLVPEEGLERELDGITWNYPSRGDCVRCHNDQAGNSLSLETRQLNIEKHYEQSDVIANQIDTFAHAGLLNSRNPLRHAPYPALEQLNDTEIPLAERVDAYLQVNCANCHQQGSITGRASWDASHGASLAERGICNQQPFERVSSDQNSDETLLKPSNPDLSTLWLRITDRNSAFAMPPLGSTIVDDFGAQLIEEWINATSSCPINGVEIPARIQAQDYDRYFDFTAGNEGSSAQCDKGDNVDSDLTNDNNGVCIIGWVEDEEWLEYDIRVENNGNYNLDLRLASGLPNTLPSRTVSVYIDTIKIGEVTVEHNGWASFDDYTINDIEIAAGQHNLRVFFDNGFVNINYLELR